MQGQAYEQLTFFPAGSPASRSVLPGSAEAARMTVTSGRKCFELSKKSGPVGCLEKMLLGSSIWNSTMRLLTWKAKVTKQQRLYFQLAASVPHINDTGWQLWATPNTMDYLPQRSPESLQRLATVSKKGAKRLSNLREQVNPETLRMWPTPTARDYKDGNAKSCRNVPVNGLLGRAVHLYPTPKTGARLCGGSGNYQQLKELEASGQITEEECHSMLVDNGGQLNPMWVEWLMGFPVGWTDLNV